MPRHMNRLLRGVLLLVAGCGYALVGRGSFLPSDLKVLSVPPFQARLFPQLAEQVRLAVIEEFLTQTGLELTEKTEEADAVLDGEIVAASMIPIVYDEEALSQRHQVSMTVAVVLRRRENREVIYENRGFSFRSEFETSEDADAFYDPESEVLEDISRQFARSLVSAILQGF